MEDGLDGDDWAATGNYVEVLVRPEGLEPPAYRFEACRSIQLSYGRTWLMTKNLHGI
jgi:hypothetical protein